jgi:hypothetical protein
MGADREVGAVTARDADGESQIAFPWCPDSAQRRARRAGPQRTKTLTEFDLHKAVAQYLDWCLAPPAFYTCFPAGWDRMSKTRAGMLNGAGLKPGFPDLILFWNGGAVGIELKRPGAKGIPRGRLSANQTNTIAKLAAAGVPVFVCSSVAKVENELRKLGWPLRGTVRAA